MNELVVMENPVVLFTDGGVSEFLEKARESARAEVFDVNTAKGRKSIASQANKVAKMKVAIDNAGKDLVSDWKSKSKLVDADRKKIRDELDLLKVEIRQPLTDWEEEQKRKKEEKEREIQALKDMLFVEGESSDLIELRIKSAELKAYDDVELKELVESVLTQLRAKHIIACNAEKEAEELRIAEEKRAEEERIKREEEEEERRIAREQEIARKAKEEAEAKAAREAKEKEEAHQREIAAQQKAIEDEKKRAEEAERQRIRDEAIAEENRKRAAEQAEVDKRKAIEDERKRVEEEKAKKAREEKARADDLAHRTMVNNSILASFVECGVSEEVAKKIIAKIYRGEVPNVALKY